MVQNVETERQFHEYSGTRRDTFIYFSTVVPHGGGGLELIGELLRSTLHVEVLLDTLELAVGHIEVLGALHPFLLEYVPALQVLV